MINSYPQDLLESLMLAIRSVERTIEMDASMKYLMGVFYLLSFGNDVSLGRRVMLFSEIFLPEENHNSRSLWRAYR